MCLGSAGCLPRTYVLGKRASTGDPGMWRGRAGGRARVGGGGRPRPALRLHPRHDEVHGQLRRRRGQGQSLDEHVFLPLSCIAGRLDHTQKHGRDKIGSL